jgi:hypothetical protein
LPFFLEDGLYISIGNGGPNSVVEVVDHFADFGGGVGRHFDISELEVILKNVSNDIGR